MGCTSLDALTILQCSESPTIAEIRSVRGHDSPLMVNTMRAFTPGVLGAPFNSAVATESGVIIMTSTRSRGGAAVVDVSTTIAPASRPVYRRALLAGEL